MEEYNLLWKGGEGKREVVFSCISRLYKNCSEAQVWKKIDGL